MPTQDEYVRHKESRLASRCITEEQQATKMANLTRLAKNNFRVIRMIDHDKYTVDCCVGFYNPYINEWTEE